MEYSNAFFRNINLRIMFLFLSCFLSFCPHVSYGKRPEVTSDRLQDSPSKLLFTFLYRKGEFDKRSISHLVPFSMHPFNYVKIPLNISTAAGLRQNLLTHELSI